MTATTIDWSDAEGAARAMAGNHRKFDSFVWFGEPDDGENWCLVYTSNRDSGLMAQSNEHAIGKGLEKFTEGGDPDVVSQRHTHWAVGHVDGYAVRVYRDGVVTDAFRKWCELKARLDDCPVLDDEDYSQRERDATLENIRSVGGRLVSDRATTQWPHEVYDWFCDNDHSAIENRDDQGGYPNDQQMKTALSALRLLDGQEFPAEGDYTTEDQVMWREYGTGYFIMVTANDWEEQVKAHRSANNPAAGVWVLTEHGYYDRVV
jgi:hypothetical protein